jgi:hypothetical protein
MGVGLVASCLLAPLGCSSEDEPDETTKDASDDTARDVRADTSVKPDVGSDRAADQRDASADLSADARADGAPDGGNCVGGGDAARDGALGMLLVQQLNCARCHQDEAVDAGLFLSGRMTSLVAEAGVFAKNLTPDPVTGLGCWTDEQIINAFTLGVDEQGRELCTRMPRFGNRVDAGTAQQIVDYLRSIPAVNKAIPETTSCPPQPPPPEAGTDAGDAGDGGAQTDGGDAGTAPEAGPDATTDVTPDAGSPDGGDAAPEAGPDAVAPDAALDAGVDVAADAAPDTPGDGNGPDADDATTADTDNDTNG